MAQAIKLLDFVALTEDLPDRGLERGQVGTVVEILAPDVLEVEFSDEQGRTHALATVPAEHLLPLLEGRRAEGVTFLNILATELRTPLNVIIGLSDMMKSERFGPLPERYKEMAGDIHASGMHFLAVVRSLHSSHPGGPLGGLKVSSTSDPTEPELGPLA
jgi:signal transduction histidine kinase